MESVLSGAGAGAIGCARLFLELGAERDNILRVDSQGVVYHEREGITLRKAEFAIETDARTLRDAMADADVFMGLSKGVS